MKNEFVVCNTRMRNRCGHSGEQFASQQERNCHSMRCTEDSAFEGHGNECRKIQIKHEIWFATDVDRPVVHHHIPRHQQCQRGTCCAIHKCSDGNSCARNFKQLFNSMNR